MFKLDASPYNDDVWLADQFTVENMAAFCECLVTALGAGNPEPIAAVVDDVQGHDSDGASSPDNITHERTFWLCSFGCRSRLSLVGWHIQECHLFGVHFHLCLLPES